MIGDYRHGTPRECSYNPGTGACGTVARWHGLADAGVEDDGGASSLMACDTHLDQMRPLVFTIHDVAGDCGMPGSMYRWEPTADGTVVSRCEFPDEDPGLALALTENLPEMAGATDG